MAAARSGKIYRHYKKGTYYKVDRLARMEATLEPMVMYHDANKNYWVRPTGEFEEVRIINGEYVDRFTLTNKKKL